MALSDIERKRSENAAERLPGPPPAPAGDAPRGRPGYRLEGQSVMLFETRPAWDDPGRIMERPLAKATFARARGNWATFWQRSDLKWHRHQPHTEVASIEEFVAVVERDECARFFG